MSKTGAITRITARRVAALTGALASLYAAAPAAAADYVMKFGTATLNETQHQYIKFYKEALEAASGGRIEVQIYPNSQLGPIPREIEGVQLGSIQAYVGPVDFFVGVDPRYGVFSAPMLFRDDDHAAATIHDPALEKEMLDLAVSKRLIGVATFTLVSSNYGAKRPILGIADFQGKKLRINGTDLERERMRRLGASGIAMPLSEVTPALDQGTIDGTISGLSVFVAFKMTELVKVVTITNDTMIISIAMVSKPWLDKLPPDLQKLVVDTGHAIQAKTQEYEIQFSKQLENDWIAMGGKIQRFSADDIAKMKTLLSSVGDDATKGQPAVHDMFEQVGAVAAKH